MWLVNCEQRSVRSVVLLQYCEIDQLWLQMTQFSSRLQQLMRLFLLLCVPQTYLHYFPHSSLHHCLSRQTKVIQVSLVWFGSRPPKTNTCKPYNMVICSGWGKERGFINNRANRAHIELRFGFGRRRGAHCGVRWNRGYSIRRWLLFQKGTKGTYRLSVSRHWQPRRLTLHVSPMGKMGRLHACAYIHVYEHMGFEWSTWGFMKVPIHECFLCQSCW